MTTTSNATTNTTADSSYLSRDFGVPFVTPRIEFNELFARSPEPGDHDR